MSRILAAWWFFPQCMEQGGPCMDPCARGWWLHPLHTGKLTGSRGTLVACPCKTTGLVAVCSLEVSKHYSDG